jgi:hypothetical protein
MSFLLGAAAILLFRQPPGEGRTFHTEPIRVVDKDEALSNIGAEQRSSGPLTTKEQAIHAPDGSPVPQLPPNMPVAILKAQEGENEGRSWLLRYAASTSIGRFDDCDIAINDNDVSRLHAQITHRIEAASAHEFSIFDYSSTNGTIVNGEPISAVASLQDGDQIQIGKTEFIFRRVQQKGA